MPHYIYRGSKPYDPQAPDSDTGAAPSPAPPPPPPPPPPKPQPMPATRRKLPLPLLSEQRRRILVLVANGKSNKEIAHALYVEVNTVKTQLTRIRERLGTLDRAHSVAVALKLKLITAKDIEQTPICPPRARGRQRKQDDGDVARTMDR